MSADMIAGYYDLYWMEEGVSSGAASLGSTGPEGIEFDEQANLFPITGDAFGPQTVVDWIYQGGNLILNFVLQEVKLAAAKKFLNPWTQELQGSPQYGEFRLGVPGELGTNVMGTLQMIPRTGAPAASYMSSGTAQGLQMVGIALGQYRKFFDTRARFIPVQFQAIPVSDSGTYRWAKWITSVS
jgi:hypothetical protein